MHFLRGIDHAFDQILNHIFEDLRCSFSSINSLCNQRQVDAFYIRIDPSAVEYSYHTSIESEEKKKSNTSAVRYDIIYLHFLRYLHKFIKVQQPVSFSNNFEMLVALATESMFYISKR